MFDEVNSIGDILGSALGGMEKSRQTIVKNQEVRLLMWLAEMCFKYDKSPEEVVSMSNRCYKHLKKLNKKPGIKK